MVVVGRNRGKIDGNAVNSVGHSRVFAIHTKPLRRLISSFEVGVKLPEGLVK